MLRYADELSAALHALSLADIELIRFAPRYPARSWVPAAWNDRFARYLSYPRQAAGRKSDVFHIVDHGYAHLLMAVDRARTVVTVHDLIPLLASRGVVRRARRHRPWLSHFSFAFIPRAAAIIADSASTKADVVRHLGGDPAAIHVVHPGVSRRFRKLPQDKAQLRRELALQADARLMLIVGRQFYKNHDASLRILASVRKRIPGAKLAALGGLPGHARELARTLGVSGHVAEVSATDDEALVKLYNAVDVLLFPSLYEGFGWPPLEAMACGLPVVASDCGSLREVVAGAANVRDACDIDGFAQDVTRILDDARHAAALAEAAKAHARRFSWEECAAKTAGVYRAVAST